VDIPARKLDSDLKQPVNARPSLRVGCSSAGPSLEFKDQAQYLAWIEKAIPIMEVDADRKSSWHTSTRPGSDRDANNDSDAAMAPAYWQSDRKAGPGTNGSARRQPLVIMIGSRSLRAELSEYER
jgi:hypothetical protein